MNVLSVQQHPGVVERVWDTARGEWAIFVSYQDVDTAWVRYGEADVTEARQVPVDQLLSSEHPSAGQLAEARPGTFELRAGVAGSDEPTITWWFVPGRRPENRGVEAYHISRTWVGAGLADWARVLWDGQEIAYTDRNARRS